MKVKVWDYKGSFMFTIPIKELKRINANVDDYIKIILRIGGDQIVYYARVPPMPKSRTNPQLRRSVLKQFAEKVRMKGDDELELQISLVESVRSNNLISNDNYFDVLAVIPEKTKSGKTMMIDLFKKDGEEWCKIWFCSGHGGKAKEIELKRFVKIDRKLGEFFGLMQAESSKNRKVFDFTNKFISEIKLFIEISKRFGIPKSCWSYTLYYKPDMEGEELKNHVNNFSNELDVPRDLISIVRNKTLLDVIYNIRIPLCILAEIMINAMLKFRDYIFNQHSLASPINEFSEGFILKDLIGDGTVVFSKANKRLDVMISEPDINAQKTIIKILNNFGIRAKAHGIKIDISTDFDSCLWYLKNNAFEGHKKNRRKLINYILTNYYFNCLYSRLEGLNECSIQKFSELNSLSYKTAEMYLYRNYKRGYFKRMENKNGTIYRITNKGKEFIKLVKKAKIELINLSYMPRVLI